MSLGMLRYKPLLKSTKGTPMYALVRELLRDIMFRQHLQRLLDRQNLGLYQAAKQRDLLLWEKHHGNLSGDGSS
jgi:hypothetical protein